MLNNSFGERLRQLRESKKLTLQNVADAVGCTKAYIWELEKRDGQRPSAERVYALAKVLGVTMEDLMGESIPDASPEDLSFFREYTSLSTEEKEVFVKMMSVLKKKEWVTGTTSTTSHVKP